MSVSSARIAKAMKCTRLAVEVLEDRTVPAVIDLTTLGATSTVSNVVFQEAGLPANRSQDEFLRLDSKHSVEQGYNSNHKPQFDEVDRRTRAVRMKTLPSVTANGLTYRVIQLNVNERRQHPLISLDELRLYVSSSAKIGTYSAVTKKLGGLSPVFDLGDNYVKFDASLRPGRHTANMLLYVPQNLLTSGGSNNPYVFLYSKFGANFANNGGKEIWGPAGCDVPPPTTPTSTSLSGTVFWDANENGLNDDINTGIREVVITLTGTTSDGQAVEVTVETAPDGTYKFDGLRPGTYAITETQPFGFNSGLNSVGTVDGVVNGTHDDVLGDRFFDIQLTAGKSGINYNFAELLPAVPS